jgi:hypothetical protein
LRRLLPKMSTEQHKSAAGEGRAPENKDVSFETQDVRLTPILKFLAYLGVSILLSYFLCLGVYRGLTNLWDSKYVPPPPSRTETGADMPPEPRLQGMPGHLVDPQRDLRDKLKEDSAANNKLGWVDEQGGIAQIPVSDAMKLIVEKGLPAVLAATAEKK